MIKVENVTKKYGKFIAVNNISFEVNDNEIVGFLGKNGAGKSTTMNMITGCIETTLGNIEINGFDISKQPKKAKREIGYMPEGVPLYNDLTVREFVEYMAELRGIKGKEKNDEIQRVIEETGLKEVEKKLTRNLSRGYKQRVSLAGALVGNPKVLILDEPTVGLDPEQVKQIRELIKALGKNHTVLLSSHILSEVSQMCEKVIIIDNGKIIAIDTPNNLEEKVNKNNILNVTVEDKNDNINKVAEGIENIDDIKLIKENTDGTKQYSIFVKKGNDIRKEIFETFAKNEITIFELKKSEATLEDAFLQLINDYEEKEKNNEIKKDDEKINNNTEETELEENKVEENNGIENDTNNNEEEQEKEKIVEDKEKETEENEDKTENEEEVAEENQNENKEGGEE